MLARIAAGRELGTCPIGQGHCPVRELPSRGNPPTFSRAGIDARSDERSLIEMTDNQIDRDEEDLIDSDELLVEEVSIDGMCGVY
jgi:mycofactocin precursor